MKRVVGGIFLVVFFLNVVIAASVADTNFITKPSSSDKNIVSIDRSTDYLGYIFWVLVVLIALYILFRMNSKKVRRSLGNKKTKKKVKKK